MNAPETNATRPVVHIVDDDQGLCEGLQWLLESYGHRVAVAYSAEEFLQSYDRSQPGCLVLDIKMRGMSGLDLQARLASEGYTIPIIMITGHGDVSSAVRSMRDGAVTFLEKPVNHQVLLDSIREALELDARRRADLEQRATVAARLRSLTSRELEVMRHVVYGQPNKKTAATLGIREKTVEVHRKHMMQKMRVHSAMELLRVILETENMPDAPREPRVAEEPDPPIEDPTTEAPPDEA